MVTAGCMSSYLTEVKKSKRAHTVCMGNGDGAANAGEAINVENRRIENGQQ